MFKQFKNLCGIYKINFPNQKAYIGQSSNIYRRLLRHIRDKDNLPVHRAIRKYNITDDNIEILETFNSYDKEKLNERERYWIKYYNTFFNGYNLTNGGDGADFGVNNLSAKLNQETLQLLIADLIENKIYIKDLSKKYGLAPNNISNINCGKSYYNPELKYPLRPNTRFTSKMKEKTGVEKEISLFNQEQLLEIVNLLLNTKISLKEIAKSYNCCVSVISNINNGHTYFNKDYQYPLRKTIRIIDDNMVDIIYNKLLYSTQSMSRIAQELNINRDTIGKINRGITHKKEGFDYPLRKTNK